MHTAEPATLAAEAAEPTVEPATLTAEAAEPTAEAVPVPADAEANAAETVQTSSSVLPVPYVANFIGIPRDTDETAPTSETEAKATQSGAAETKSAATTYVPEQYYHVVSMAHGFVAAYYDAPSVRENILKKFRMVPFVTQRFRVVANCATDTVWVVLFRANDAVAFVSNSRDEAERVRAGYAKIGLSYDDSIDYWECKVGVMSANTLDLLTATDRAHQMYAGPNVAEECRKREEEEMARLDKLLAPIENGPVANLLREMEEVTIFDGLVDIDSDVEGSEGFDVIDAEKEGVKNELADA